MRDRCLLWGRAAGRCERKDCNKRLWQSPVSTARLNLAQLAHIWSYGTHGPRGRAGIGNADINGIDNLILVCPECHLEIDNDVDGHPAGVLKAWKRDHETRVELATDLLDNRRTHVVLYCANVGEQRVRLSFEETKPALVGRRYPHSVEPIRLGTTDGCFTDRDATFWHIERGKLAQDFRERLAPAIAQGDARHVSVFALAPQPLLVLLGTLLPEIYDVDVYNLSRGRRGWTWPRRAKSVAFRTSRPSATTAPPALVVSVTASISDERVIASAGGPASIWRLSVDMPQPDAVKCPADLESFRGVARSVLAEIANRHGISTPISIFLAAPVCVAVELGRARSPKAAPVWRMYDQASPDAGFNHVFDIP